MTMSKNDTRRRVMRSFVAGKADRAGAFRTNGETIFSYALPLAGRRNGVVIALPGLNERYSVTTSGHQSAVRAFFNFPRE